MPIRLRQLLLLALLPVTTACSSAMRPAGSVANSPSPVLRIHDTKAGRDVPFAALAAAAADADIVFFGEMHDDPVTHAAELAVLAALGNRRADVVLSLEMFERDVQATLDNYLAGRITEKEFLDASRPWPRYATDYRPLVELARVRGWPVVAANIPRRLASAVSRAGLAYIDTIAAADKPFVAVENLCPRDAYHAKFVGVMGGAASHSGSAPADTAAARASLERYYQAQCVKDEAMAESIARALSQAPAGAILLHVNGAFHSDEGLGTVDRTLRRLSGKRALVITAVPVAEPAAADPVEHKAKADFLLFTRVSK